MPLFLPILCFAVLAVMLLILPLSIIQRFRAGFARRRARGWVASVNAFGIATSAVVLLTTAAMSSFWVPDAFIFVLGGLAAGMALGVLGVGLTRWESRPEALFYTPNRWLLVSITLAVVLRLGYGLWRALNVWQSGARGEPWLAAAGFSGSMAAGALVIGYYLAFWTGVWYRVRNHVERTSRG